MEYFKFTRSYLNTITFEQSDYEKLDDFLKGTVKNFLSGNYGYISPAPTEEELQELTNDLKACYVDMLTSIVPQYEEVLRLSTPTQYTNTDTTTSKYGDEEVTGKYFEPIVNSSQAEVKSTGQKTEWNDDEVTVEREEYKTFNDNAVKDFFTEIKPNVEDCFVEFINPYADGDCEEFNNGFTEEQIQAINSGITANKVNQIETNKNNISTLSSAITEITNDIDTIETRLDNAESDIDGLVNRVVDTEDAIDSLENRVDTNESDISSLGSRLTNAESDIDAIGSSVDIINSKIPNQASSTDQLAPKSFVNSTIQTATANFRGNWLNWASVPINPDEYPADYLGVKKPTSNDYMVVQDASGYVDPEQTLSGTWRFKYLGLWETDGRNGWRPEYQVNATPMTSAQLDALNSGATEELIDQITTNEENIYDLQSRVSTNESDISSLDSRVTNTESDIDAVESRVGTNETNISSLQSGKANTDLTNVTATRTSEMITIPNIGAGVKYTGKHLCIESFRSTDEKFWYRKYDDGWKECGGVFTSTGTSTPASVYFPLDFSKEPLNFNAICKDATTSSGIIVFKVTGNISADGGTKYIGIKGIASYRSGGTDGYANNDFYWSACGY